MSEIKKRNIIIGALCTVLLLMAVGYAAFSSILNIAGTSQISSNWDVKITNIVSKNVVGGASNAEEPSYDNTNGLTATFKTNLVNPGDSIEYDITITNNGTLNAKLDKITLSEPDNEYVVFETSGITEGDKLNAGSNAVLTVKVTFKDVTISKSEPSSSSLTVALDYSQADGNGGTVVPSDGQVVYSWSNEYINIGHSSDSITGITSNYTTLNKSFFLKHIIVNQQVESSEACFVKDNILYCLKPNEYETSKSILLNVFGEAACTVRNNIIECTDGSVGAGAGNDGFVYSYIDVSQCRVSVDGGSMCVQ